MKVKELTVCCSFNDSGENLPDILEESFRIFLGRILAMSFGDDVSWSR